MEGWFRWDSGNVLMRDDTGPSGGWLLGLGNNATLRYRVGGTGFVTDVDTDAVRDGSWHHLVATKDGDAAALYLDGELVHSGNDAGSTAAALPWHVMRNGSNTVYTKGDADEVALYGRALTADEVREHYDIALELAGRRFLRRRPTRGGGSAGLRRGPWARTRWRRGHDLPAGGRPDRRRDKPGAERASEQAGRTRVGGPRHAGRARRVRHSQPAHGPPARTRLAGCRRGRRRCGPAGDAGLSGRAR